MWRSRRGRETDAIANSDDEWLERSRRLHAFLDALRPLAAGKNVGEPFGENFGLAGAMSLVPRYFANMDEVRLSDGMLCMDLLMGFGKMGFEPDDLDETMGSTERAFQASAVAPARFAPVKSLCGAAKTFVFDNADRAGMMWDLWNRNDEVASEFLCWHAVARLRLATAGKMDSVSSP